MLVSEGHDFVQKFQILIHNLFDFIVPKFAEIIVIELKSLIQESKPLSKVKVNNFDKDFGLLQRVRVLFNAFHHYLYYSESS